MKNKSKIKKIIAADISLYLLGMGTFLMFHYIVPYNISGGTVIADTADIRRFSLPEENDEDITPDLTGSAFAGKSSAEINAPSDDSDERFRPRSNNADIDASGEDQKSPPDSGGSRKRSRGHGDGGGMAMADNDKTTEIASDSNVTEFENFSSVTIASERTDSADITVNKCSFGIGNDTVTYYIADIYVTSAEALKTAFAYGSYGKNIRSSVAEMARSANAVIAVSGDYYGNSEDGVVIRNGVLYRNNPSNADICVLFSDGNMKTYSPDQFNADEVIAQGAWQAWTFGPSLLDENGNISNVFNTNSYINSSNPRCAIGMVSPGHYVFAVVDGRDKGYSRGATMTELAAIMSEAGCVCAYNLDGGKSSAMFFGDDYISSPADGGRDISDIIYIG